ncbi:hypothetical protein E2C01_094095 [Portunus trituberculatus]|uniref:Uncharacterized protein n=1 Tax=Portunus trituberculatus TaxID=210409 RepID=A0A5B7K271_PORTR|nr:hypothetical protein [Portunus trituberculatus]
MCTDWPCTLTSCLGRRVYATSSRPTHAEILKTKTRQLPTAPRYWLALRLALLHATFLPPRTCK